MRKELSFKEAGVLLEGQTKLHILGPVSEIKPLFSSVAPMLKQGGRAYRITRRKKFN